MSYGATKTRLQDRLVKELALAFKLLDSGYEGRHRRRPEGPWPGFIDR